MKSLDFQDIVGGIAVMAFGGAVAGYGLTNMSLGTAQRMGPGFFPVAVGVLLCLVGIAIVVPAFFRQGPISQPDWRALIAVPASLAGFALTLPLLGLAPAIFVLVALSTFAQRIISTRGVLLTAGVIALLCYVVFDLGLGLGIAMYRWPF